MSWFVLQATPGTNHATLASPVKRMLGAFSGNSNVLSKGDSMTPIKAIDVFTPGTYPEYTYVDRNDAKSETDLNSMLRTPGMLISIAGPSKSGKTVLVEKIVGTDNLIPITGAGIKSAEDLWKKVLRWMGDSDDISTTAETSVSGSASAEVGGKAGFLGTGVEAKGGVTGTIGRVGSETRIYRKANVESIIKEIAGSSFVVFIDDFHYIPKETQTLIAQEIKEAIRNDVKIITASIPYHADDTIRVNPDLRGRVYTLDLKYWTNEELMEIARLGLPKLNIDIDETVIRKMADNAVGSPQLMQQMLLVMCNQLGIEETVADPIKFQTSQINFGDLMQRTAMSADYFYLVDKLLEGPKIRGTERNNYKLSNGKTGDVYKVLMLALSLEPPVLVFKYDDLQKRISRLCSDGQPSGSSVIGSCQQIADISEDLTNSVIIEWDSENDSLHIRDPYLLFFIRWSEKMKSIK